MLKIGSKLLNLMKLKDLLKDIEIKNFREIDIMGITHDSRKVKKGYLFVALRGKNSDGHRFIKDAEEKGAIAFVVEQEIETLSPFAIVENTRVILPKLAARFYGYPSKKLKLIGITGTNGKTTISYMLRASLNALKIKTGLLGTIEYDLCNTRENSNLTTPEATDINFYLNEILKNGGDYAILEASSHGLSERRLDEIFFDVAIFTNLQRDHLDYHGTLDEYRKAKGKLFKEHIKPKGWAVINADDSSSPYFLSLSRRALTYSIDGEADIRAKIIHIDMRGVQFLLEGKVNGEIHLSIIGKHNVYNALATITALYILGHPLEPVFKALENFDGVPGRFERVTSPDFPFQVFVDYAHTPEALINVLRALRSLKPKRIIVLFGAGGNRDRGKRPPMARVAESNSDYVVITTDNPRGEDPLSIISDIEKGFTTKNYIVIPDRKEAIFWVIKNAKAGDIILLAGKGHETYQIIGNIKTPFNDKEVATEALKEVKI